MHYVTKLIGASIALLCLAAPASAQPDAKPAAKPDATTDATTDANADTDLDESRPRVGYSKTGLFLQSRDGRFRFRPTVRVQTQVYAFFPAFDGPAAPRNSIFVRRARPEFYDNSPLWEYLASHGYIVVTSSFVSRDPSKPYIDWDPQERRATLTPNVPSTLPGNKRNVRILHQRCQTEQ